MEQADHAKSVLESPLIPNSEESFDHGATLSKKLICDKTEIMEELKMQMHLAGPLVVVSFLEYSLQMISVMYVGHLDELSLASASMATSFAGVTGFSFMLGMGSALETLCGQAYGAKQNPMLALKQDPQISLEAGIYACWLIPSILPFGLLQCQLRFLQTQNNVFPLMITTGVTSLVHVLTCWTFLFGFGFGSKGAALSCATSYWVNVFILAIYIKFSPTCRKTWTGFSKEALENLHSFLGLGIPSALMVCLEYWSYEFLVLMSGLLPNPKLETSMMSISLNTSSVVFRIPYGLGSAISTRVSNELGAERPYTARLAVLIAIILAVMENLFLSSIAVSARDIWGWIARGCGWQKICVYVNLAANYLVGLPSAISLTFFFQIWRKGTLDGNHMWEWPTSTFAFNHYNAHKLEGRSEEGQEKSVCLHNSNGYGIMKALSCLISTFSTRIS
ncbi:hypothetical protein Patl1_18131 [Pistacia atlantica]|uniref:Uncharacterized protein n=1 Tax=Pistacia atlantica TaxID=434234 RepID=A0ACC1BZI5_9ROSI|nr:hypothetical protein Patl1_18131 [Pistacia atlantica]